MTEQGTESSSNHPPRSSYSAEDQARLLNELKMEARRRSSPSGWSAWGWGLWAGGIFGAVSTFVYAPTVYFVEDLYGHADPLAQLLWSPAPLFIGFAWAIFGFIVGGMLGSKLGLFIHLFNWTSTADTVGTLLGFSTALLLLIPAIYGFGINSQKVPIGEVPFYMMMFVLSLGMFVGTGRYAGTLFKRKMSTQQAHT